MIPLDYRVRKLLHSRRPGIFEDWDIEVRNQRVAVCTGGTDSGRDTVFRTACQIRSSMKYSVTVQGRDFGAWSEWVEIRDGADEDILRQLDNLMRAGGAA